MIDDRPHRVIRVALRVVGIPHTKFIERVDMKMLAEFVEVQAPMVGTVKSPKFSAMNKNEIVPFAGLEVSGSHTVQNPQI